MAILINNRILNVAILAFICFGISAQSIPADKVLDITELSNYLKQDVRNNLESSGEITQEKLAAYFRTKFTERFFYDHNSFYDRLLQYNNIYKNQAEHKSRALDHMGKYSDSTQWVLPFNYLNGKEVNAYALRHLARQHKMVDIAFHYFNDGKNPKYIKYFENQMRSLNAAFELGEYEKIKDGNGVYEVFRSGYRILNWLWIHNMLLNEEEYSASDQLQTIATLLQHGSHLYKLNNEFRPGNHQTRGMSALAMLSILFRDFEGTELWFERAMLRLGEHLEKEINDDGFQFERSVHYHISDINNYLYVYQLARISEVEIDKTWEEKLRILFTTLVKIAYPDKSAPVLQDDTDIPWAEKNKISGAMTLGYLLFEDPEYGYFATDQVDQGIYWFLQNSQIDLLKSIEKKKPKYGSLFFPNTHYYIMREGWNDNDKMMIISAGLDSEKPDHQHGDMLGIQAMANGQVILPNYQVRYSLKDFDLFKNSMVKNVALVDDQLLGKEWTSNKGGSGFGKFKNLPNPKTIVWESNKNFDLFIGSHDGFENIDVEYSRTVIFVKNKFWIIRDNFQSDGIHEYKQVFQGHYTEESGPNLIRATFPDASGCDIFQLKKIDKVKSSGARGKQWTVLSKTGQTDFNFLTVIFPYRGYNNRFDETIDQINFDDWQVNKSEWEIVGDQGVSLSRENENYFFDIKEIRFEDLIIQTSINTDIYLNSKNKELRISLIGDSNTSISVFRGKNKMPLSRDDEMKPGDQMIIKLTDKK